MVIANGGFSGDRLQGCIGIEAVGEPNGMVSPGSVKGRPIIVGTINRTTCPWQLALAARPSLPRARVAIKYGLSGTGCE